MRKLRTSHPLGSRDFNFAMHRNVESIARIEQVLARASGIKSAASAKAAEVDRSAHFTPTGKAAAKRQFVESAIAPVFAELFAQLDASQAVQAKLREIIKPAAVDRTDVAREMRMARWERYWEKLDPPARATRLKIPELCEPGLAELLTDPEYPPEMFGITAEHRMTLTDRAAAATHPLQVQQLEVQDAAERKLTIEIATLVNDVAREMGLGSHEVARAVDKAQRVTAIGGMFPELPKNDAPPQAA